MADLYLIAHKVRGEPAFDIAEKLQIGDEEGWIIPTSGHRAYPYWTWSLEATELSGGTQTLLEIAAETPMPPDLPDHYTTTAAKGEGKITGLFAKLGFKRAGPTVTRRI